MPRSFLPSQPHRRFRANTLLPVIVITLSAVALTAIQLFVVVHQSDALAVARQIQSTRQAIDTSIEELTKQQLTTAIWDQAVLEFRKPAPNLQWVDDNIGLLLNELFDHAHVYVLDARDQPLYAMVDGRRASARVFEDARSDLAPLIRDVRALTHDPHVPAERTARLADKATSDAHLMDLLGRPAIASAMKIVPSSEEVVQAPGDEAILISVRFLDDKFLAELSQRNFIDEPRFSRTQSVRTGERVLPLAHDGTPVGYFIWRPELPGTKVLWGLGPITALVLGALLVTLVLLVRSLRRSMLELQASEAHAQHLASHDVLTGLPNRAVFDDRLDQALARTRRGEKFAVLALDLDRFKQVNDTLGHQAGDNLIQEFASRLSGLLRPADTVARLGGDEFAVIQAGIVGKRDVDSLCARILSVVRQPFALAGGQSFVGVSIGIVLAPEAGSSRVDLVRKADIALYHAKDQGRDRYRYFAAAMDETVKLRGVIEHELRAALAAGDRLKVFYQPVIEAAGQTIVGLEALVRWQHPVRGLIPPDQFIPIAEATGLIVPLGEWVLRQACAMSLRWPDLFLAVNLSPVQVRSSGFAQRVIAIVEEAGATPRRIELEVTEGVLLENDDIARGALKILRNAGFKIALDDFGTGYSSLSYLRHFEVDKIKIDRSFVQHLGHVADTDSAAIITAIATLGNTIGLTVTAEGVETDDQRRLLSTIGCDELQGYLFSRAVPEDQLAGLFAAEHPA
ncbi:MAG: EAL domain-containing protein [Microvirga sp.]